MRWVNGVCKDKPKTSSRGLFTKAYLRLTGTNKIASLLEIFVRTEEGEGREGDMPTCFSVDVVACPSIVVTPSIISAPTITACSVTCFKLCSVGSRTPIARPVGGGTPVASLLLIRPGGFGAVCDGSVTLRTAGVVSEVGLQIIPTLHTHIGHLVGSPFQ